MEKRKKKSLEGVAADLTVFTIQLSILNRMSFFSGISWTWEADRPYGSYVYL